MGGGRMGGRGAETLDIPGSGTKRRVIPDSIPLTGGVSLHLFLLCGRKV